MTCKECVHRKTRMFAKGTYHQCLMHKCKLLNQPIYKLKGTLDGCPLKEEEEDGNR